MPGADKACLPAGDIWALVLLQPEAVTVWSVETGHPPLKSPWECSLPSTEPPDPHAPASCPGSSPRGEKLGFLWQAGAPTSCCGASGDSPLGGGVYEQRNGCKSGTGLTHCLVTPPLLALGLKSFQEPGTPGLRRKCRLSWGQRSAGG